MSRPRANFYIDGLNFYRQKLIHHPSTKWVDLRRLAAELVPTHDPVRVRYFTSLVRAALGNDPQAPARQAAYLRALRATGTVDIHLGRMRHDNRYLPRIPIALNDDGTIQLVKVRKTEEKGSDVNLASTMVLDAARGEADVYVLLSNDSDFAPTLHLLREELGVAVGLLSPLESPSADLRKVGPLFTKIVRVETLLRSQLPETVADEVGTVTRPVSWR